jgi:CubicO group peptidase (beta-lactamase class C family)
MARFRIPGISFALITEGRQVWTRGFGIKDTRANDPVDVDTVFAAGSLTKPVFAYAVLALVEQKLFALDTPLAAHLPGDLLGKEPRLRLVTARMLLSHTSGIAAPLESPTFNFAPGDRYAYASTGFLLLQLVVERVTGKSLAEFMRVNLLEPFAWTTAASNGPIA